MKVLVIDDEPAVRLLLRKSLEFSGHEVATATDGAGGLHAVRDTGPDVIVLDLMMPNADGFDVLRSLAADGSRDASAPVIVLTALTEPAIKARCYDAGAATVMTKPFDPSLLAAEIDRLAVVARQGVAKP